MYKRLNELLAKKIVILDGAMGTMLQKFGLKPGACPEGMSVSQPEDVINIHKMYIENGADIIYSNTFGANRKKLASESFGVKEAVTASISCAKKAAEGTETLVALDVGPIGELLVPFGTLEFEDAVETFKEVMSAGAESGADLIVIETMTDLYEVKAAVIAAKESCDLPILVTMTYEENERTLLGNSALEQATLLEGLGVFAIGLNCSLGPRQLAPIIKQLIDNSNLHIMIKPNAGLPDIDGKYSMTETEFATEMVKLADMGVTMMGGCCGTSPAFIGALSKAVSGKQPVIREKKVFHRVCSSSKTVYTDKLTIIGERINPTGKPQFKQAMLDGDIDYITKEAVLQTEEGAQIINVNVCIPDIDEAETLEKAVKAIQGVTDTPLMVDSMRPGVLERAARIYNGKPIIDSVNGAKRSLERVLPIVKKYGAAVVGLTLDEGGIPRTAEERVSIAEKIIESAGNYGIGKCDILIDPLALTASAQQADVLEAVKATATLTSMGIKTTMGVSNVSYGLPNRNLLNSTYLTMAMMSGLTLPIINTAQGIMETVLAYKVLANIDENSEKYVSEFEGRDEEKISGVVQKKKIEKETDTAKSTLINAVVSGYKAEAAGITFEMLNNGESAENIINSHLIKALDEVGDAYEAGELFLPQLLKSAMAAESAFDVIKNAMPESSDRVSKGKIILATVKGDIHDIGKNIVKVMLQSYGYEVLDLGRDISADEIVKAQQENGVRLVGLSTLMTTTLSSMEKTIKALNAADSECKIAVGGAVLTEEYAKKIGADYYAKDAKGAIDIAKCFFGN